MACQSLVNLEVGIAGEAATVDANPASARQYDGRMIMAERELPSVAGTEFGYF
jgi:hypothetical protein